MERQLTLRMPADLAERLDEVAKRLQRKRSEIMRTALEQFLETETADSPIERVRDLLGQIESGLPDLGERHREYLIKRIRHGR
ncbi:MAG: ribbon-helix-helix domain-containing protein [Candidatus Methanosuratincola petrocarbonis]|jgi:predicted transcriptional regulator